MEATVAGIFGALWLGSLWLAASAFRRDGRGFAAIATRLADAIALGVAIPLALAALGMLVPVACFSIVGIVVVAGAIFRKRNRRVLRDIPVSIDRPAVKPSGILGLMLPTVATVCVAWPALVRPLLQGDSLGYHLPNAATWAVAHTLWTTGTSYWWYPGASELFAAGLFTVSGPLAVTYAGFVALLLLANRIAAFAERAGLHAVTCGAVAAAFATIGGVALQSGSLENDVWLSAWILEVAWSLLEDRRSVARSLAVTVLLKPYGFLFAVLAAIFGRARLRDAALGFIPIVLWIIRDAVLWKSATIDPAAASYPDIFGTTIVAQGLLGFTTLVSAIFRSGPGTFVAFVAFAVAIVCSRDAVLRWTACCAFIFYLVEPFGFRNDIPQLATGESLRYAFPALSLGFVGSFALVRRCEKPCAVAALTLAVYQIAHVVAIFANDSTTRGWLVAAFAVAAALGIDATRTRGFATVLVSLALVAYSGRLAGSHPVGYYDDLLSHDTEKSHFFAWLAREHPKAVVGDEIRIGAIAVVTPGTFVQNAARQNACEQARHDDALLAIGDDPPTNARERSERRARGKACGSVVFDDGLTLVVAPAHT